MSEEQRVIGLIAGGRQFPVLVAQGVKKAGHRLVVACFEGHSNMAAAAHADVSAVLKLGKLGKLLEFFKKNGVQHVIMAGTIDKPKIMDVRHFDMRALKLIFKNKSKGDSTILGALTAELESEGMRVVPAHIHVPDLLTPEGVLTKRSPTEQEWEDLRYAWKVAKELGRLDIGQCLVVREGIVAAVEALEGTDEAIRRGCKYGGENCVVVKVFKPGQEDRVDLPSAGTDTIRTMAEGKGSCLGIEAGRSLLFDREETLAVAEKAGICVVGLTPELLQG
ncbi:MAG: UDP-2,3-diacylglucosamine diphosphatase LpxI [Desulfovibrionaceae bacterium]